MCRVDLISDDDSREVSQKINSEFSRVDVLALCGGGIFHGALERAPLAEFDSMYRSNFRGHYALTQAGLPLLRKRNGQVVFINSSAGLLVSGNRWPVFSDAARFSGDRRLIARGSQW